jgi:hypothetical protein
MKKSATCMALCTLSILAVTAAAETPPPGPEPASAAAAPTASRDAAGKKRTQPETMDRLELGSTTITGNRELPKVMYVVPWKRADIGELGGKPLRSLVDEVLEPVDREVFGRENSYFRVLEPAREGEVETPVTAGQGKP